MRLLSTAGLLLGATMSFGLVACGSSGTSDVTDITSAAMTGGDIPSGFQLNSAGTADSWSAYSSPTLAKFGVTGGCTSSTTPALEKSSFQHGLGQTALDANGYGIKMCAEILNSDDNAKTIYQDGLNKSSKAPASLVSGAKSVSDESFAAVVHESGITGRVYGFRHANTLIEVEAITKSDNVSTDELYTIANNIDGRLK